MKKTRRLLRTLLVMLLVMFTLSSGMTVSATNKKSDYKAFSSVKVGGKKLNLKEGAKYEEYEDVVLGRKTKKARVKVKLKSGWKLKKITYYDAKKEKKTTVKNGGTIKANAIPDSYLRIKATNGSSTATIEFAVFNDFDD